MRRFKDVSTIVLLILSIIASTVVVLNSLALREMISREIILDSNYNNTYSSKIVNNFEFDKPDEARQNFSNFINGLIEFKETNIIWKNVYVSAGNNYSKILADIYLTTNEECRFDTIRGKRFSKDDSTQVILGEAWKTLTYEKDNERWINIFNVPCKVIDYFNNNMSGGYDDRIVINMCDATKNFKDAVLRNLSNPMTYYNSEDILNINIFSDGEINKAKELLVELAKQNNLLVIEREYENNVRGVNKVFVLIKQSITVIATIFSIISCASSMALYVRRRIKQCTIRRVFGYSYYEIAISLLKGMIAIIISGEIIGTVLFLLQNITNRNVLIFLKQKLIVNLAFMGMISIVFIIIIVIYSIYMLHRHSLIEMLKER